MINKEDILNQKVRHSIITEIFATENLERKKDSLKKWDFYHDRHEEYVYSSLCEELSEKTVKNMRKVNSINVTKRIVDESSSVYMRAPNRMFMDASDNEAAQLESLYAHMGINNAYKKGNKIYNLADQCVLNIMPKMGGLHSKILAPHHYDVVPDPEHPEKAMAYIINASVNHDPLRLKGNGVDEMIADDDDASDERKKNMRLIWWTDENHFVTDGLGEVIDEILPNPIGKLPFVEIAREKEFEFWVKAGCSIVDFAQDFCKLLSDTANISRLQGYSQAVIYAEKIPEQFFVGPNQVLHLPLDPSSATQPKFEFVTPSPDMGSALKLLENYLSFFLTSRGVDPKTINSSGEATSYNSGLERLLAMFQQFEATQDDFEKFKSVEQEAFDLVVAWSNALQNTDSIDPSLNGGFLSDAIKLDVEFKGPEMLVTQEDKRKAVLEQLGAGLMSRAEAVSELRGVTLEQAKEILEEVDRATEPVIEQTDLTGS